MSYSYSYCFYLDAVINVNDKIQQKQLSIYTLTIKKLRYLVFDKCL